MDFLLINRRSILFINNGGIHMTLDNLTPETRLEQYLAKIAEEEITTPEAKTRLEAYLAKIAGEDVEVPEPRTRLEYYMNKIAENGGGETGDFTTCQITITNNTSEAINIPIPTANDTAGGSGSFCDGRVPANEEVTFTCILYKGYCVAYPDQEGLSVNCEGLISYEEGEFAITGDGTITIATEPTT